MAYRFMNRHLKGDNSDPVEPKPELFKPEELRVFAEDKDIPADQLNTKIDELFVPKGEVTVPSAEDFAPFKDEMLEKLREYCFRAWPEKYPDAFAGDIEALPGYLYTEPPVYVGCFPPRRTKYQGTCWVVVLNPDEKEEKLPEWETDIVGDEAAVLLMPRGVGPTDWTTKNPHNYVERSLALLGRTVDSGRVWDVRVAAFALRKMLSENDTREVTVKVLGKGQAGIIAAYAALFEPAISEVILVEPTETHTQGPHFLNVLRVLDIPDALGLLAPRKLTIYGTKSQAFEKTAAFYKIAGAEDKFAIR
jgi:hypothetical protein